MYIYIYIHIYIYHVCMYTFGGHQKTRVHAHAQARGAMPELWRVADTTTHGLSAGRYSTQTSIGTLVCVPARRLA